MNAPLFDRLADVLETRTSLSRLEARGTLRLALREAGLEADTLTPRYVEALCRKILPAALAARGVEDAADVSRALVEAAREADASAGRAHRPEALFERLQGG